MRNNKGTAIGTLINIPKPASDIFSTARRVKIPFNPKKIADKIAKVEPIIQCSVGNESQEDAVIIDNLNVTFNSVVHHLPKEMNNVKNIFIKTTMGKSFPIDDKGVLIMKEDKATEPANEGGN